MYQTTTDLLIIIENDIEASQHIQLEKANNTLIFNKQHDVNNLIIAENDESKHESWIKEQQALDEQIYHM
jgi:hypothetical protein